MSDIFAYHVFFGLLVAIGGWLLIAGLTGSPRGRALGEAAPVTRVTDLPPLAQRLLGQPLTDIGFFLFRHQDHAAVEDRLRRSGWRYTGVGDYYGSKVSLAVIFFLGAVVAGVVLGLPPLLLTLAAAGLGVLGLQLPDHELRQAIAERRDSLYREMAWTLDRIAMVMKTGEGLQQAIGRVVDENYAWVGNASGGLFMALLRDIAAGMSTRRSDIKEMLDELRRRLPDHTPELDEFMAAVQVNLTTQKAIADQIRALGRLMRDQLNNRIDETAQKAELKVVALTSGVIVPSLLIVVLGAAVIAFTQNF
jgi:Flp pilus assembly protein TadB